MKRSDARRLQPGDLVMGCGSWTITLDRTQALALAARLRTHAESEEGER